MSECYLCGAHIQRGSGFRRTVETGTSTRVYVGSRRGASFGASSGTRTVCATCAAILDKTNSGFGIRMIAYLVGWALSAWVGFSISSSSTSGGKIVGLLLMLGLPVIIGGLIFETLRKKSIVHAALQPVRNEDPDSIRPDETIDAWLARVLPNQGDANPYIWRQYAKVFPPKVGQPIIEWVLGWPDWDSSWNPENIKDKLSDSETSTQKFDENSPYSAFLRDDTITSWATRVSPGLAQLLNQSVLDTTNQLIQMAKYTKPLPGETFNAFRQRSGEYFETLDRTIDLTGKDSAIRDGDSNQEWLARVAPLFLEIDDGESIDDILPALVRIAEQAPPEKMEPAMVWLDRVRPLIASKNATRV